MRSKSKKIQPSKHLKRQDTVLVSWSNRIEILEKQSLIVRGMESTQRWSETRAARIEELRMQVAACIYKVDSLTLAESIVKNRTHFLDESRD